MVSHVSLKAFVWKCWILGTLIDTLLMFFWENVDIDGAVYPIDPITLVEVETITSRGEEKKGRTSRVYKKILGFDIRLGFL